MRSGWLSWVRTAAAGLALAAGVWAQGAGAAEVKNVTAKYAWPWGVGIRYEVIGTTAPEDILVVKATDRMNNATYTATTSALSGDTGGDAGMHQVLWELDKQGLKIHSTNMVFTVEYSPALYIVVDLSGGPNAEMYPVTGMNEPPSGGFNVDDYKTTKLVLRKIEAGTFTMGSPANELGRDDDETQHQVILTKPFYMGIFEVTLKQWNLLGEGVGSFYDNWLYRDTGPVGAVLYKRIRGSENWPTSSEVGASSFVGKLRAKTGLEFDLPTEAQWEYACRAGTKTSLNSGKNLSGTGYCSNLAEVGRYAGNRNDGIDDGSGLAIVGSYRPNAWGLYDMHGNVWEWCRDWYTNNLGTVELADPKGPNTGKTRVIRGGSIGNNASECRSSCRLAKNPDSFSGMMGADTYYGFRLAITLSE